MSKAPPLRILCVDDDTDILAMLGHGLGEQGGCALCLCISGGEALKQVQAFLPDLILLDVTMPHMSGPQLLTALQGLPDMARVPVVFLTANALPGEISGLMNRGAAGVIAKPFDPRVLLGRLVALAGLDLAHAPAVPAQQDRHPAMARLRDQFRRGLSRRAAQIAGAQVRDSQAAALHQLAGAAGSFGFDAMGDAARAAVATVARGGPAHATSIGTLLTLMAQAQELPDPTDSDTDP